MSTVKKQQADSSSSLDRKKPNVGQLESYSAGLLSLETSSHSQRLPHKHPNNSEARQRQTEPSTIKIGGEEGPHVNKARLTFSSWNQR